MKSPFYLKVCGSDYTIKYKSGAVIRFKKINTCNWSALLGNNFPSFDIEYKMEDIFYRVSIPSLKVIVFTAEKNTVPRKIMFSGNKELFEGMSYRLVDCNTSRRKICLYKNKVIFTLDNFSFCDIFDSKKKYISNIFTMFEYVGIFSDNFIFSRDMPVLLYSLFVINYQKSVTAIPG